VARVLRLAFLAACLSWSASHAEGVDFVLSTVDGVEHRLSDYRGKWVVVNFWATWCPPCLDEIPLLVAFHAKHKDIDAVVLGINFEHTDDFLLESFIEDHSINYPVLLVGEQPLVPFEPLKGLPSTFFVAPDGTVASGYVGPVTTKIMEAEISGKP
jgi:thiol-disulfide isomerase/thioredoxin